MRVGIQIQLLLITSLVLACGQVSEKEVAIAYLPEGEDNAAWVGEEDDQDEDDGTDDSGTDNDGDNAGEDDQNLTGLAAAVLEMQERKNSCGGGCDFLTEHEVQDAIVIWASNCSSCTSSANREVWVHDFENKTGALLYFFNSSIGTPTEWKLGDKVSFKIKKFTIYNQLPEITEIDPNTVSHSSATTIELFSFFEKLKSFEELDFDNLEEEPNSLYSGAFKIVDPQQFNAFPIHTKNYTGDKLRFFPQTLSDHEIGNCYQVKNIGIHRWYTEFQINERRKSELGSVEQVECSAVGL